MAAKRKMAARAQPKKSAKSKPQTIDEYLAMLNDAQRETLERLRKLIHAAAPGAEECISYQLAGFRLHGKCFIWIGAAATHCAIYGVVGDQEDLKGYDTSGKGTLRFSPDKPLPAALVRKLVKMQVARLAAKGR